MPAFSIAQNPAIKFGKVTEEELLMKICPMDTSAGAMVLADYGSSYFNYDQVKERFQVKFERHIRIKIFKKSGYDVADDVIPYYRENSLKEEISSLKGFTYNMEKGKIVKTKLEKEGIFDEVVNDNWTLKKITLPNIKEGSVIEYTYTVNSSFLYNLREWEFQRDIPVQWSEYAVKIPEFFDYKVVSQGYEPFLVNEKKQGRDYITFTSKERNEGGPTTFSNDKIDFMTTDYKWATSNVPAISEEPYMTTIDDYVTKIEFELASIQYPRSIRKDYSRNWESITEELLTHEKFGKQLDKGGFLKNEIIKIVASANTSEEKASAVYNYVKSNIKWNGSNRMFTSQNLKKTFEEKSGNSADINLLLILMLREAGLDAEPLILSTRDHGRANMHWPTITKFNYVIAHVVLDDKTTFVLDATDPFLPSNILPYKCLNGEGKVISKKRMNTVKVGGKEKQSQFYVANYDVDALGVLKGTIQYSRGSLLASDGRKMIFNKGKDKYIEDFIATNDDWEIEDFQIQNLEAVNEILKEEYKFNSKEFSGNDNSILYFNPLLIAATTENPFKLDSRKFPVDFACPMDETIIVKVKLPEGYKIDEKPESLILTLPDNTAKFTFSVTDDAGSLQITSRLSITSRFFVQENYLQLREFFNHVVAKHTQQVVLKKI